MQKSNHLKIFLCVLIGVFVLLMILFWPYLSAIILALIIASLFHPLFKRCKRILKGREALAALIMVILIFLILVVPIGWMVTTISNQAFEFYAQTKDSVSLQKIDSLLQSDSIWMQRLKALMQTLNIRLDSQTIYDAVSFIGKAIGLFLAKQLNAIASNVMHFFIQFVLMLFIIYYIFRDGRRIKRFIVELMPVPAHQQEELIAKFHETGRALIVGNAFSGILQGVLGGLGFFIFSLGSSFFWGTVITFVAFLPVLGASIIYIPAAVILWIQGPTWKAIAYLVYNIVYSSLIEYILKPRLIGQHMQINPVLLFIAILGGIHLFGILGILYGPLVITIFLTLVTIYKNEYKSSL